MSKLIKITTGVAQYLYSFFSLQLFITILSLPILICWGLPFTLMSPLSNLVLTPFLSFFLLLCSLLFFSHLIGLPCFWIVRVLEYFSSWIYTLLNQGSFAWLVCLQKNSLIAVFCIIIIACLLMHIKRKLHPLYIIGVLTCLLSALFIAYTHNFHHDTCIITSCVCNHKQQEITIIRAEQKTIMIDPGYLASNSALDDWFEYTLAPFLIKNVGTITIDHCIIMQPTIRILQALIAATTIINIKHIYIPWMKNKPGTEPSNGDNNDYSMLKKNYRKLKWWCKKNNSALHFINNKPIMLPLTKNHLTIEPLEEQCSYKTFTFSALLVHAIIDQQVIDIYNAKSIKNRSS